MGIDQWTFIASGAAGASGFELIGRIGHRTFNVRLLSSEANSFHPRLHGRLDTPLSGGTDCRTAVGIAAPVRVFVAVLSAFLAVLGLVLIATGYDVPGIASMVFLGLLWVVVGRGVSLAGDEEARLVQTFVALLDGHTLPGPG